MTQKGIHTWDLVYHYHRCPQCGKIIESREDYHYELAKYVKDLKCPRCHQVFTVEKQARVQPGPLFGEGDHAEVMWE